MERGDKAGSSRRALALVAGAIALLALAAPALASARTAYVANNGSDDVTPIDTQTNTAGTAIAVGADPLRGRDHPRPAALSPRSAQRRRRRDRRRASTARVRAIPTAPSRATTGTSATA